MPIEPDDSWTFVARSATCDHYSADEDLLYIIPDQDSRQTAEIARASLAVQAEHWRKVGRGGAVIIFMDPILEQSAEAREVYVRESAHTDTVCYALIGESFFAMASASVYAGLAKPAVPTEIFRSVADAMPWVMEMLKRRDR